MKVASDKKSMFISCLSFHQKWRHVFWRRLIGLNLWICTQFPLAFECFSESWACELGINLSQTVFLRAHDTFKPTFALNTMKKEGCCCFWCVSCRDDLICQVSKRAVSPARIQLSNGDGKDNNNKNNKNICSSWWQALVCKISMWDSALVQSETFEDHLFTRDTIAGEIDEREETRWSKGITSNCGRRRMWRKMIELHQECQRRRQRWACTLCRVKFIVSRFDLSHE